MRSASDLDPDPGSVPSSVTDPSKPAIRTRPGTEHWALGTGHWVSGVFY